jgi:3-oxoacyl-[acyl-carrier protein] reductase
MVCRLKPFARRRPRPNSLDGRSALITGGSRGIGRGIVERLAADGCAVVFSYLENRAAADEVLVATRGAPGPVHAMQADIGDLDSAVGLFDAAEAQLGGLDILVNNAAVGGRQEIAVTSESEYDRVMGANAKGTFFLIREAARRLRDGGRIVNVSTINTVAPAQGIALYAGSKGAIEQFTAVAATELGKRGITVNTVSPGFTDTDLFRGVAPAEERPILAARSPLGRLGSPADIAATVAFLVSEEGGWMTGQNLRPSGGVV